ncbi:MAG: ADP-forming succinate--CoA ligase subunit beta [Pirellulales bacterium]
MKIHEYQGKEIFRKAGVAVLRGQVAKSPEEAAAAFKELGGGLAVVKAQIHAGGRGKGTVIGNEAQRGVQLVRSAEEAATVAKNLLGNKAGHHSDGTCRPNGLLIFVEEGCKIARELYLGIIAEPRGRQARADVFYERCGVEIEKVAEETPERSSRSTLIHTLACTAIKFATCAKSWKPRVLRLPVLIYEGAGGYMMQYDCSLVEINPLVVTEAGDLVALDAKVTFDDNAMFRHKDLAALRDLAEEDPAEVRASNTGLSFVKLDGDIGCLVNGAGLAMSTMDIIKLHGGEPANFLDVGGGANTEQVTEAFRILLADPNCKAVLVNIFGGIARCTTIANAIVAASKAVGFNVPLVVRLEGTEVKEGREILANSGISVINAEGLTDAAKKVVAAAKAKAAK